MKPVIKGIFWLVSSLILLVFILIGIAFFIFDSENIKSQVISAVKEETSANLTIEDELSLSFFPWLKVETGNIRLSNPDGFNSDINLLLVEKLNASVKFAPLLKGQIELGDIELTGSELNLIRDGKGRSNIEVLMTYAQRSKAENEPQEAADISSFSVSRIALQDFVLNQYAPREKLTQSFSLNQFEVNQFALEQWTPVTANGSFKSDSGKAETKWQLNTEIMLSDSGKLIELRAVDATVSSISDKLKQLELTGNSSIKLDNENAQVNHTGRLKLDEQDFELGVKGSFSNRTDLELDLKTQALDLTPWLVVAGDKTPDKGSSTDTTAIADFLKTARIKGSLSAELLTVKQMTLRQMSANLFNDGATLWLKPVKAKAFQGNITSSASINFASKPLAFSTAPNLQEIEVGDLIGQVFEVERLSGLGDVSLNLKTQGLELKQMLRNLSGDGSIALSDGALSGLDLNKLIESGINLQTLTTKGAYSGKTKFAGLNAKLKANKGLLQMNNLSLVTPLFDLTGKASTDAHKESLSGKFKLTLKGVLKDQLEQKYPQLVGMDLPFQLKGTWSEPQPSIDFESLLKARYKSELDKKVKDKKKELEDELKKKLLDKLKFD